MARFSDDDFIDFAVTEAIMLRGIVEEKKRAKQREKDEWKSRGYRGERP